MSNRRTTRRTARKTSRRIGKIFTERKINNRMRKKLVGSFGVIVLALVGLSIRITYINASDGEKYKKQVLTQYQQHYESRVMPFKRGDILDSNGTLLATSEKVYKVILDCKVVNSDETFVDPTIKALVDILGMPEDEVEKKLTDKETRESQYQVMGDVISITDKKAFEEYCAMTEKDGLSEDEAALRRKVRGIWFEETYIRKYPLNQVACDVIGFTNSGNTADWGIEGYYCDTLNGVNGRQYGYFNSDADVEQTIIEPVDGNSVVSTIDVNIQETVEKTIRNLMSGLSGGPNSDEGAKNVGVVVMNPNTGAILAMASDDQYDLNNPRKLENFYSTEELEAMNEQEQLDALNEIWKNYCISDTFEPGSTVKPMTVAAALESGSVSYDDTFYCDGYQEVGGRTIKCGVYPDYHGEQTLGDSLKHSCNDVMMQIAEVMGVPEFVKYERDSFNFGRKTGIDLPGEASGITYDTSSMGQTELATSSFGQGFTCTMIQEAAAFSSVINGGYYYRPYVVKQINDSEGAVVKTTSPVMMKQTVSQEISDSIKGYLGTVMDSDGTGRYAKVEGYSMGGKSGTAQKLPRGNGKYLVSFIGFAPLDNPEVVIYAVIDEPNVKNQSVSVYAQYLVNQIAREILPYMNIFKDEEVGESTSLTISEILQMEEEDFYESAEGVEDTAVPSPLDNDEEVSGGNGLSDDGVTNDEAGFE